MTRSVFTKVFMNCIALGFACFFLIVSGGSYLIELRLEERTVQELQKKCPILRNMKLLTQLYLLKI